MVRSLVPRTFGRLYRHDQSRDDRRAHHRGPFTLRRSIAPSLWRGGPRGGGGGGLQKKAPRGGGGWRPPPPPPPRCAPRPARGPPPPLPATPPATRAPAAPL